MSMTKLVHPHGELSGTEVMIDYLDDNLRRLNRYLEEVNVELLHWQLDPESTSIAVQIWHMGRILDVFFTRLALGRPSDEECWIRLGWAAETGYDPRGLGRDGWGSLNEYTLEETAAIPKFSKALLLDFIAAVYDTVRTHLQSTSMTELAQPGVGFEGKFTQYQIISMALMDNVRHLGEIRLVQSLWARNYYRE